MLDSLLPVAKEFHVTTLQGGAVRCGSGFWPNNARPMAGPMASVSIDHVDGMLDALYKRFECVGCGAIPRDQTSHTPCSRCNKVFYCCGQCEQLHWSVEHRDHCAPV